MANEGEYLGAQRSEAVKFPDLDGFFKGAAWHDSVGAVRVMGTIDGYVIYRRKGGMPSVQHWRQFTNTHMRTPAFDQSPARNGRGAK